MRSEAKKKVSLVLPWECYDRIKELADDTSRSVPNYIRVVIYNYLSTLDKVGDQTDKWWMGK